jgi:hypothetical protein
MGMRVEPPLCAEFKIWISVLAAVHNGAIWAAVTRVADRALSSEALAGQFINDMLAGCRPSSCARRSPGGTSHRLSPPARASPPWPPSCSR